MNIFKRTIDILMTILLLFLMAYQVTGEVAHEFIGVSMFILVIIHQVLNIKWYSSLFKGKYNVNRVIMTVINVLLLFSFLLTAISGMAMSNFAVPFLYNIINVNTARAMHLAFSYWSFILMGMHLGLHISMIVGGKQFAGLFSNSSPEKNTVFAKDSVNKLTNIRFILTIIFVIISAYGLYIFINSNIVDYITFKTHFAFFDYEKNKILVIIENAAMLIFFASITNFIMAIIRKNILK